MEEIKLSKIDKVRVFFNETHKTGLNLRGICKEADIGYYQMYDILNKKTKSMTTDVYDSLLPVMIKYGYKKEEK